MGKEKEGYGETLQATPTFELALVCAMVVFISVLVERAIYWIGWKLKDRNKKPLYEALEKVKEELMLLGFISLFLMALQKSFSKIRVPSDSYYDKLLPCKNGTDIYKIMEEKNKDFPLMSIRAFHGVHIFIFVLAITHVVYTVCTLLIGIFKINQWKDWEKSALREESDPEKAQNTITKLDQDSFVKNRIVGFGKLSTLRGWVQSFFRQFLGSITESDYKTVRRSFIKAHCGGNSKINFHKYMITALEDDFKKVVGISWKLWIFVVAFLFVNIHGWNVYFWISFAPLIISLVLGTKLDHIITEQAQKVAEKNSAVIGDVLVQLSDKHFLFGRPHYNLSLIHYILFQNAFEMAIFMWVLVRYGFPPCIDVRYTIARLVIGVSTQVLCSFSTLPIYAFVTQMRSSLNKEVLDEYLQAALVTKKVNDGEPHERCPAGIQTGNGGQNSKTSGDTDVINSGHVD